MKTFLTLAIQLTILLFSSQLSAQATIEWEKTFGGSGFDTGEFAQQTEDGGYIVGGLTTSNDGDVSNNNGFEDCWIFKTDESGNLEWEQTFGGSSVDYLGYVLQLQDGTYMALAYISSSDGEFSENYGGSDLWVLKLDATGTILWDKNYGGSAADFGEIIQQTEDGGILLGGSTRSVDQDVSSNNGASDYWIIKTDLDGTIEWEKTYGGTGEDFLKWASATPDGGYILGGDSRSTDGDASNNYGQEDLWVVKIDASGTIEWEQNYGGSDEDNLSSIQPDKAGGYIISGSTLSDDIDVGSNTGIYDYWIFKIDDNGTIEWEDNFGGFDLDLGFALQQTDEGGYLIAGWVLSDEGDVGDNYGNEDLWVIKLNSSGALEWEQNYGGSQPDQGYGMQRTADAGYIIAGASASSDIDVANNNGESDVWLVKLAPCLPDNSINQDALTLTANAAGLSYQWLDCDDNLSPIPNAIEQSYDASAGGTFAVAISEGNCTVISECIFVLGVDTEELENQPKVLVYPNPVDDQIYIEQESQMASNIQILDIRGSIIASQSENQQISTLDISDLASGIYFVKVATERGSVIRKIVKE